MTLKFISNSLFLDMCDTSAEAKMCITDFKNWSIFVLQTYSKRRMKKETWKKMEKPRC